MSLTVRAVLDHPSLAAGAPVVRAGACGLGRRVRWIHSSEVLEIAPLLRGGELLLSGGHELARAGQEAQRRYVRELAERQVAGVALETGPALSGIPSALLEEADGLGFPVVELSAVVPFVEVAEQVNAALVNASVDALRYGGELAHALAAVLAAGGGLQQLLDELHDRTSCPVALYDGGGERLAGAGDTDVTGDEVTVSSRISLRGAHAGTLEFGAGPDADVDLLVVAGERANEALALALLRAGTPTPRDLAASELARLAGEAVSPERLERLAEAVGLRPADPVVALAVQRVASPQPGLFGLDEVLRRHGVTAVDSADAEVRAVISLPGPGRAPAVREQLVTDLREWSRGVHGCAVSLGPVAPRLAEVGVSMRVALRALASRPAYASAVVVDAATTLAEDLFEGEHRRADVDELVRGQLGMVLAQGGNDASVLLDTLEAYLESGCNKTRTADRLHLQRQSLYARLDRVFALVGGDPTGTPRALPLHLALRLRHGRHFTVG